MIVVLLVVEVDLGVETTAVCFDVAVVVTTGLTTVR